MMPLVVPHHLIDAYFPLVSPYLEKAIEHGRCSGWTVPGLYQACARREAILFVDSHENPKNALVGRFETWAGEGVFYIMFMGGEGGGDWAEGVKHVREFANQFGVNRVCAHLRKGWLKHFKAREIVSLCEIEE